MSRYRPILLGLALLLPAVGLAEAPAGGASPDAGRMDRPGRGAQAAGPAKSTAASGNESIEAKPSVSLPTPKPVKPADAQAAADAAAGYLQALKAGGFGAAPVHLHPQALERFKTLVMPRLDQDQARGTRTLLNATFGRDASFATAKAADPSDFMARFVRVVSARDPEAAPRFGTLTPLGVVAEGDRLHVLVRLSGGGGPQGDGRIEVVSLLQDAKSWKVLLDSRLEEMARALGGTVRADDRRSAYPRMEPMPEGVAPLPLGPQGPAGLPPLDLSTPAAPARPSR